MRYWIEDFLDMACDIIAPVLIVITALATVFGAAIWIGAMVDSKNCHAGWSDFKPTWGLWEGCRIEVNGKRVPVDAVRKIEVQEDRS